MKRYPHVLDCEATCRYPFRCPHRIERRRVPWHAAASLPDALSCPLKSASPWNAGSARLPSPPDWHVGGRSSCCWRLARQLMADGLVEDLSAAMVRRILAAHQLNPWRQHVWLDPKQPRAAAFSATVSELLDLD